MAHGDEIPMSAGLASDLGRYVDLLARWNKTVNLTALTLDPPDDMALTRLVMEPLRASSLVQPTDQTHLDLGSGGGSPAIPLHLACPWLESILIESRGKKCAFLREAARTLGLTNLRIGHVRFEELLASGIAERPVDLITMRAVRADEVVWGLITALLSAEGLVIWFGGESAQVPSAFAAVPIDHGLALTHAGSPRAAAIPQA
ncbi:MAG: 16S rRNA (guanine(527)-N(7))-methyltransferase RsmG [Vicinamibacterales bacterium]